MKLVNTTTGAPCYTWSHGELTPGIRTKNNLLILGEEGPNRNLVQIPCESEDNLLESVGIDGAKFLILVDTKWVYTRGSRGETTVLKGKPVFLETGNTGEGIGGNVGGAQQYLISISEGDILLVKPQGGERKVKKIVILVENGEIRTEDYYPWMQNMLQENGNFNNFWLPGAVDETWIGKQVDYLTWEEWNNIHITKSSIEFGVGAATSTPVIKEVDGRKGIVILEEGISKFRVELYSTDSWIIVPEEKK